jgi:hypothetical protein
MPPIAKPGGEAPTRSRSAASATSNGAKVHRAQILSTNTRDFTVDVRFEAYPYSTHFDIPYMVPYVHQVQGEGINFAPEVGSTCWVCQPSEGGRDAFVLGWTIVAEDGAYRGGRQLLNPGDIHLSTRDGNFVFLRRGGIVQIGATPICQRLYIPINNVIRDFAENYELSTPGGDLTWLVEREEDQGDGHRPTTLMLACKEFADDPNKDPIVVLKIGSHGEGNETILSLETRDKGGGAIKTKMEVSKIGKITWKMEDNLEMTIKGNWTSTIKKKMSTTSDQNMSFESKTEIDAKAPTISLNGNNAVVVLSGTAKMDGSVVNLGDAMGQVVIDTGNLSSWLMAVTALLSATPGSPAVQAILPPLLLYKSTKVKA